MAMMQLVRIALPAWNAGGDRQSAMRRMAVGLFAGGLAMAASAASADDPAPPPMAPAYVLPQEPADLDKYYSPTFDLCLKAAHSSRDTEICSLNERGVQTRRLDEVYKRRLAAASPSQRSALEADQAAWAEASSADCHAHSRPGRWGAIGLVACVRANAISRRLQLEGRLDD